MASRIDPQELLSDPRHVINLSLSLYQLQQQGCMCDCSIRARQGSLDVHRLVLMASDSPYFQENLHIIPSTDGQFSGQPETSCISLRDQDLLVVQAVIQFVYMGEMCVSTSNVDRVLALCKLLGLARAEKLCETFIRKNSDRQSGMMSDIERSDNVVSFVNFPVVSTPVVSINRADEDKVTSSNVDGQNIPIPVSQIQPTITSPDSGGISAFVSSASSSLLGTMYIYRSGDNNTAADARSGADAIEKIDIKINPSMSDEDIDDDLGDGGYDMHDVEDSKFTTALLDSISTVAASSTALQLQENTDTTNTRKRRSRKPGKRAANSVKKTTTGKGQKRTAAPKSKPIASTSQIKTRRTASASHDNTETTDIGQSSNVKGEQTAGQSSTLHDPVCDDSDADVDDHKSDLDETQATDASENSKQKGSNVSNYCRSCKIRFSDKEKFQEHKKEVHQFTCEVCGWSSDRGINLASHMFNQHGVQYEPDKYPLRQCDQPADDSCNDYSPSGTLCSQNLRTGSHNLRTKMKKIIQLENVDDIEEEDTSYRKAQYPAILRKMVQTGNLELDGEQEASKYKTYIASLSQDQKSKSNASARERMKRYRERLKGKQKTKQSPNSTVVTRIEIRKKAEIQKQKREYWKEQKRASRAKLSFEEKRELSLQRRLAYSKKREKVSYARKQLPYLT